jgi:hypothetical protein
MLQTLAEGITHVSEWYFADANDLIVGVRSGIGIRVHHAPGSVVLTRVLRSNHFGYFESEAVALQVARWLQDDADASAERPGVAGSTGVTEQSANQNGHSAAKRTLAFRSKPQSK